jgi:hypothetical protein
VCLFCRSELTAPKETYPIDISQLLRIGSDRHGKDSEGKSYDEYRRSLNSQSEIGN